VRNGRRHYPEVLTKVNLAIIAKPLGWVAVTRIYIRKRDGEVDVVEIKVGKPPVLELFLCQRLDLHPETPLVGATPGHEKILT